MQHASVGSRVHRIVPGVHLEHCHELKLLNHIEASKPESKWDTKGTDHIETQEVTHCLQVDARTEDMIRQEQESVRPLSAVVPTSDWAVVLKPFPSLSFAHEVETDSDIDGLRPHEEQEKNREKNESKRETEIFKNKKKEEETNKHRLRKGITLWDSAQML